MQDAFGEVGRAHQRQGVDLAGAFQVRHALLVALPAALELLRPAPLVLPGGSRSEGHGGRTPQPGEHHADAGIEADQAERHHPCLVAGQGRDPHLLAVRLHGADKAVGMKGSQRQGPIEQARGAAPARRCRSS